MTAGTVRVVVADDDVRLREAFALLVGSEEDLALVGTAADGAEAVALVAQHAPDVVVMDLRMPGTDGVEATRQIVEMPLTTRVLALTMFEVDELVLSALRAGASGFLLKSTPPADVLAGVRTVARGESLLGPSATRVLLDELLAATPVPRTPSAHDRTALTARETDVLTLVGTGLSNLEIAAALVLSHATVRTYISRLLLKLEARDRAQLVIAAYERGLVGVPTTR